MQLDIDALNLMVGIFAGIGMTMFVLIVMYHMSKHDDLPPPDGNVLLVTQTQLENIVRQRVRATLRKIREKQKEIQKPEACKQPQPTA